MTRTSYIQLAIALSFLALSVGGVVGGVVLLTQERERAEQLTAEIGTKRLEALRVAAAKEALPALATDETAINQYFIKADDIVPFLETLQRTGTRQGAEVEVLAVSADQGGSQHRLSLSLRIVGTFDAVMRTVGSIEYGPYDIALSNVTLDTMGEAGKKGTVWTAATVFTIGTQPGDVPVKK